MPATAADREMVLRAFGETKAARGVLGFKPLSADQPSSMGQPTQIQRGSGDPKPLVGNTMGSVAKMAADKQDAKSKEKEGEPTPKVTDLSSASDTPPKKAPDKKPEEKSENKVEYTKGAAITEAIKSMSPLLKKVLLGGGIGAGVGGIRGALQPRGEPRLASALRGIVQGGGLGAGAGAGAHYLPQLVQQMGKAPGESAAGFAKTLKTAPYLGGAAGGLAGGAAGRLATGPRPTEKKPEEKPEKEPEKEAMMAASVALLKDAGLWDYMKPAGGQPAAPAAPPAASAPLGGARAISRGTQSIGQAPMAAPGAAARAPQPPTPGTQTAGGGLLNVPGMGMGGPQQAAKAAQSVEVAGGVLPSAADMSPDKQAPQQKAVGKPSKINEEMRTRGLSKGAETTPPPKKSPITTAADTKPEPKAPGGDIPVLGATGGAVLGGLEKLLGGVGWERGQKKLQEWGQSPAARNIAGGTTATLAAIAAALAARQAFGRKGEDEGLYAEASAKLDLAKKALMGQSVPVPAGADGKNEQYGIPTRAGVATTNRTELFGDLDRWSRGN